jgi:hypothetical protein
MSAFADGRERAFRPIVCNSFPSPPPTKSAFADREGEGQVEGAARSKARYDVSLRSFAVLVSCFLFFASHSIIDPVI